MVWIVEIGSPEKVPVPVDSDGSLPVKRFERYFPGAVGLCFCLPENDVKIPVNFGRDDTIFLPPDGGWNNKVFFAIRPSLSPNTSAQMDHVRPESPYPEAPRSPAPMAKSIDKFMFFARDEAVVDINEMLDFILLKCDNHVVEKGPSLAQAEESESFLLAGYGNTQELSYFTGIVHLQYHYFHGQNNCVSGPFILGTGVSSPGDSGGACWGPSGLIGMNFGCTQMPTAPYHSAISNAAIFSPKNYMAPSVFFGQALQIQLAKERSNRPTPSPSKKKTCHVATLEGIGTGELLCDWESI